MKTESKRPSICLFGAAPDTGNQGVTALCQSAVLALHARGFGPVTVFDHGRGARAESWRLGEETIRVERQGAVNGRRLYRTENLRQARIAQSLGGLGHPLLRRLRHAAAVLDVSGGDSFSDIYGASRFETITLPKRLTLAEGRPLILLPQTYGPYESEQARAQATHIIAASTMAWARDAHSFSALKKLLGARFDPSRHRLGVDMAFGLPRTEPGAEKLGAGLQSFLADLSQTPLLGLNASGLLFNRAEWAREIFGLGVDYRELLRGLLAKLLQETGANVVLVPHVHQPIGNFESDLAAATALVEDLPRDLRKRVAIPAAALDASEAKWLIGKLDWFAGSRMHATIAALSTGVPALALAYSGKTQGVFESCGQGAAVIDLRAEKDIARIITRALGHCAARRTTAHGLKIESARVRRAASHQMDEIAGFIRHASSGAEAA